MFCSFFTFPTWLIIKQLFRIILQAVGVILSHRLGNTSEKCLPENMPSHFICAYFFQKKSHIKYWCLMSQLGIGRQKTLTGIMIKSACNNLINVNFHCQKISSCEWLENAVSLTHVLSYNSFLSFFKIA